MRVPMSMPGDRGIISAGGLPIWCPRPDPLPQPQESAPMLSGDLGPEVCIEGGPEVPADDPAGDGPQNPEHDAQSHRQFEQSEEHGRGGLGR